MMQKGWDWNHYVPTAQFHIMPPVSLHAVPQDPNAPTVGFPMLFIASMETLSQIHFGDLTTRYNHPTELVQETVFLSTERE